MSDIKDTLLSYLRGPDDRLDESLAEVKAEMPGLFELRKKLLNDIENIKADYKLRADRGQEMRYSLREMIDAPARTVDELTRRIGDAVAFKMMCKPVFIENTPREQTD